MQCCESDFLERTFDQDGLARVGDLELGDIPDSVGLQERLQIALFASGVRREAHTGVPPRIGNDRAKIDDTGAAECYEDAVLLARLGLPYLHAQPLLDAPIPFFTVLDIRLASQIDPG